MRRDVSFFVQADLEKVYNAYLNAATHAPFERTCKQERPYSISFGVNYSFKYNMNGGACTIHFMPHGTGTAVIMRFSVAQLAGARYEKYANDLNKAMTAFLPASLRPASYLMEDFINYQNGASAGARKAAPAATAAPVAPQQTPCAFCSNCGKPLRPGSRFCAGCGAAAPARKVCPQCGASTTETGAFCTNCGVRLSF